MSELARFDPDTGEVYDTPPIVPVADARPTWHEAGRIRVGVKVPIPGRPGKFRPAKLTRFRLTSSEQDLIERAAELYGGKPEPWADAPGADREDGEQWQVTTLRNALPIRIPPAAAATQAWEAWSGGGCERRCDGRWELFTDGPCVCTAEAEFALAEGRPYDRPCRKTTRVSMMLDDFGAGIWRLETHSTISGDELATWLRIVFPYLPPMAPLVLRVTKTERKRRVPDPSKPRGWDWQTFVFPLVSIDTRDQTMGQMLAARDAAAVPAPAPVAEVARRVADQDPETTRGGAARAPHGPAAAPGPLSEPPAVSSRPDAGGSDPQSSPETHTGTPSGEGPTCREPAARGVGQIAGSRGDPSPAPNPRPPAAGAGEQTSSPSTTPEGEDKPGRRTRDARKGKPGEADHPPAGSQQAALNDGPEPPGWERP